MLARQVTTVNDIHSTGCGMWVWCVPGLIFQKLEAMHNGA